MDDATLALLLARARMAFGLTAVLAPRLATRIITGKPEAVGVEPLFARMIGARDLALGLGTVIALDHGTPVRGWLEGSALADAGDCLSALASRKQMTERSLFGTMVLAGFAAVAGAVLGRRLDPAPPAHPHQPEAVVTGHHE
jgi:hypothetical protein